MIAALTGALPSGRLEEVRCMTVSNMVFSFALPCYASWKDVNQHSSVLSDNSLKIDARGNCSPHFFIEYCRTRRFVTSLILPERMFPIWSPNYWEFPSEQLIAAFWIGISVSC